MLSHRNLLFMSHAYYADIERVEPGDLKLHAAPLSHGSGLYGLPHLLAGRTIEDFRRVLAAGKTLRALTLR